MSEHGGAADQPQQIRRSRLADYAEMTDRPAMPAPSESSQKHREATRQPAEIRSAEESDPAQSANPAPEDSVVAGRRRAFAELLGEFRRTAVLVPLGEGPGPDDEPGFLTVDLNGIRFILAFSDEQALARYAQARGEYAREWAYRTVLGARLLDVAVPAAGVPCGVALDCADGPDGMVFPPVVGIVPEHAAVDRDLHEKGEAA
ncbi:hypothetical protein ABT329_38865 [Streptomyces minutiscleroticus]|nr:hypothetical protein [Streptomyces minutiscleroticus]